MHESRSDVSSDLIEQSNPIEDIGYTISGMGMQFQRRGSQYVCPALWPYYRSSSLIITHPCNSAEIQYTGLLGLPFGHVTLIHDLHLAVNPKTNRIRYHLDQWRVLEAIKNVCATTLSSVALTLSCRRPCFVTQCNCQARIC